MQYHGNGFRPGNPDVKDAAATRSIGQDIPGKVDVLVVGCGPAGLCLAAQLARFPEISTMIVDAKPGPIEKGQADGVSVRSMEMFQAFGFAEKVKREAYWVNQSNFWMPEPADRSRIRRVGRVQDVADDQSEMPHTILNQARIHEFFLEAMRNSPTRLEPHYGLRVVDLAIDQAADAHPVAVTLERAECPDGGQRIEVAARYVVGCDGARSTVRKAIGGEMHGDAAHQAWGVMDVLANTDFPDIRYKNLIASAGEGNIVVIPREGGYLVRLYVELDKLNPDERVAHRNLTCYHIIAAANRIMQPYSIDVKEVVWWSIYEIAHRLSDRFDDVPPDEAGNRLPRVFTAGDACHTHSPKAGQGMNVSMGDAFNLGWKLALVLQGRALPDLLRSYSAERRAEAKRLVETDHRWARVMSAPPGQSELDGADEPRIVSHFKANLEFTGGLAVHYEPSVLTAEPVHQALAQGLPTGKRFHSAPVIRACDAFELQLGHVAEADGRFRLYVFEGSDPAPMLAFADWLMRDPSSPVVKFTRLGEDIDSVIDVRAVFQAPFDRIDLASLHPLWKPAKGRLGLQDHEKAFCVDPRPGRDIYALRGIERERGCVVVVRPDQYVANVLPLDATAALAAHFDAFLLPAPSGS